MFDLFKFITVLGEVDSNGLRELFFWIFFYWFVIPVSVIAFLIYCFVDSSKHKIIINNKDNNNDESNIDVNENK